VETVMQSLKSASSSSDYVAILMCARNATCP